LAESLHLVPHALCGELQNNGHTVGTTTTVAVTVKLTVGVALTVALPVAVAFAVPLSVGVGGGAVVVDADGEGLSDGNTSVVDSRSVGTVTTVGDSMGVREGEGAGACSSGSVASLRGEGG
jgi:hypothetical protein